MSLFEFLTLQFSAIHPITKYAILLTVIVVLIVFLKQWFDSPKLTFHGIKKPVHQYLTKTLNNMQRTEPIQNKNNFLNYFSNTTAPLNLPGEKINKNQIITAEFNDTQTTKKREILDNMLSEKNDTVKTIPNIKPANNLGFLNQYKVPSEKPLEKPVERNDAKSTPFFGHIEKRNPLLGNQDIHTSNFNATTNMNIEKNNLFGKPQSSITKTQKEFYLMDTPSKKKEQQESASNYFNKAKNTEKGSNNFSNTSNSAFKKYESPKNSEKNNGISKIEKKARASSNIQNDDKQEINLGNPIKIKKRKVKEPKENSDEANSEDGRKATGPIKKIKKDPIKEKIIMMKNKAKEYNFSENSSDSFDEKNFPIIPNRNVFIKNTSQQKPVTEKKIEKPEEKLNPMNKVINVKAEKKLEEDKEGEAPLSRKKIKPNEKVDLVDKYESKSILDLIPKENLNQQQNDFKNADTFIFNNIKSSSNEQNSLFKLNPIKMTEKETNISEEPKEKSKDESFKLNVSAPLKDVKEATITNANPNEKKLNLNTNINENIKPAIFDNLLNKNNTCSGLNDNSIPIDNALKDKDPKGINKVVDSEKKTVFGNLIGSSNLCKNSPENSSNSQNSKLFPFNNSVEPKIQPFNSSSDANPSLFSNPSDSQNSSFLNKNSIFNNFNNNASSENKNSLFGIPNTKVDLPNALGDKSTLFNNNNKTEIGGLFKNVGQNLFSSNNSSNNNGNSIFPSNITFGGTGLFSNLKATPTTGLFGGVSMSSDQDITVKK